MSIVFGHREDVALAWIPSRRNQMVNRISGRGKYRVKRELQEVFGKKPIGVLRLLGQRVVFEVQVNANTCTIMRSKGP